MLILRDSKVKLRRENILQNLVFFLLQDFLFITTRLKTSRWYYFTRYRYLSIFKNNLILFLYFNIHTEWNFHTLCSFFLYFLSHSNIFLIRNTFRNFQKRKRLSKSLTRWVQNFHKKKKSWVQNCKWTATLLRFQSFLP